MSAPRIVFIGLITFHLATGYHAVAQQKKEYDTAHLYPVSELKADFAYARTLLEKVHPSLYRYTPKDSLDFYFDQSAARLDHPMTELEFWHLLQTPVVKIRSGHTEADQSKAFERWTKAHDRPILPIFPVIRDNKLYVSNFDRSLTGQLAAGDEIISINNEPAESIIKGLRSLAAADGYNNGFKDYQIEQYFGPMYNYLHPVSPNYQLVYRHHQVTARLNTAAMNFADYRNALRPDTTYGDSKKQEYRLYEPDGLPSTAVLRVRLFLYEDFEAVHRMLFKKLSDEHIKNLVIDLRGNNGGAEEAAIDLLKYLVDQPFTLLTKKTAKVDGDVFMAGVQRYNKSKSEEAMAQLVQGIVPRPALFKPEIYQGRQPVFNGRVYLLVDEGTFSVAALFAVTLKLLGHATVIGRETGGGLTGCDGYYLADIALPYTKVRLNIPLYYGHSVANTPDQGRGLQPDIVVERTFGPDRGKMDAVLAKVKELIGK